MSNFKCVVNIILCMVLCINLCACGHEHEFNDATCTSPAKCKTCGEIKGSIAEHQWIDATCTEPQICNICKSEQGKPNGHFWMKADCDNPKVCKTCKVTEGKPKGHKKEIGKCGRCKKFINKDIYNKINDWIDNYSKSSTVSQNEGTSVADIYENCCLLDARNKKLKNQLNDLIKICGDYKQLKSVKKQAKKTLKLIPNEVELSSDMEKLIKELIRYLEDDNRLLKGNTQLMKQIRKFCKSVS